MRIYVGVTDQNWFRYLAGLRPDEVNFWQPGGKTPFKVLARNEMFLCKLHSPINQIVGGGFFAGHSLLPVSIAWQTFGQMNGVHDLDELKRRLYRYRRTNAQLEPDPVIGCIVLISPFFFPEEQWIPVPEDWKPNIVQGKSYDTETTVGRQLFQQVQERLQELRMFETDLVARESELNNKYGKDTLVAPRLGQGAFRVVVTEAYSRRCAITGEKTLPVLDAAHIKPYSDDGPHEVANGLLLRQDIHTLFDRGYLTVDEEYRIEVSRRIKEDYGNGREYYALHGKSLAVLPGNPNDRPSTAYLQWHNESVFLG